MSESVEEHIAHRKALAEDAMEDQGPLGRAKSRAGLAVANGIDRATPTGAGAVLAFAVGGIGGVLKGGTLGFAAAMVMVFLGASAAGGLVYSAMAIGAVAYGAYHALKAVQDYRNKDRHTVSDRVAEMAGASPAPTRAQEKALERQQTRDYYENEQLIFGFPRYAQDERRRRENREQNGHNHNGR